MSNKPLLPANWEVPQVIRSRLGNQVGRQRAMIADGHLLLVLHAPPKHGEHRREGRFFWRRPDGTWSATHGEGAEGLRLHLGDYASRMEQLEQRGEEGSQAHDYFEILRDLVPLERATTGQLRALQEAREAIPEARELIDFRDIAGELDQRAEQLYRVTHHGLDYTMAKRAEEQARADHQMARTGYRLNILAAIFFPIMALSAVFGTNLRHGFEQVSAPWPFVIMMASGGLLGLFLWSRIEPPMKNSQTAHGGSAPKRQLSATARPQKYDQRQRGGT